MAFIYYQYFLGRGLLLDSAIQSKLPRGEITSCGIVVSQITTNMFQVLQLQSHHFSPNKIYRIRLITVLAFIRAKKKFFVLFFVNCGLSFSLWVMAFSVNELWVWMSFFVSFALFFNQPSFSVKINGFIPQVQIYFCSKICIVHNILFT